MYVPVSDSLWTRFEYGLRAVDLVRRKLVGALLLDEKHVYRRLMYEDCRIPTSLSSSLKHLVI